MGIFYSVFIVSHVHNYISWQQSLGCFCCRHTPPQLFSCTQVDVSLEHYPFHNRVQLSKEMTIRRQRNYTETQICDAQDPFQMGVQVCFQTRDKQEESRINKQILLAKQKNKTNKNSILFASKGYYASWHSLYRIEVVLLCCGSLCLLFKDQKCSYFISIHL